MASLRSVGGQPHATRRKKVSVGLEQERGGRKTRSPLRHASTVYVVRLCSVGGDELLYWLRIQCHRVFSSFQMGPTLAREVLADARVE